LRKRDRQAPPWDDVPKVTSDEERVMSGFELQEATIEGIHDAIRGEITAAELVRGYLARSRPTTAMAPR
jgi:hypothetical protein